MTDTTVERDGGAGVAGPAVTRAALILDVLAETGDRGRGAERARASARASRSRRSPTSAARSPTRASSGAIGTGFSLGRRLAELGGAYLALGRPGPGVLRRRAPAAGRLRGDGPVRGPRRARGHLPRAPRRAPAGPPDVAASGGGCRPSRPRPARPPSRRSPIDELDRRLDGLTTLAGADPQGARARSTSCWPTSTRSGGAATRSTTRRPWRASSATASMIPRRQPGEGRARRASRCSRSRATRRARPGAASPTCTGWPRSCPTRSSRS